MRHLHDISKLPIHSVYRGDALLVRARIGKQPFDSDPGDWKPYVSGAVQLVDVPCDHLSLLDQKNIPMVAAAINDALSGFLKSAPARQEEIRPASKS